MPFKFTVFMFVFLFHISYFADSEINKEKPQVYMGRQIAYTMHSDAAEWLTRKERESEENTKELIEALELKPGMIVADIGCGNGYHSLLMAPKVGEKGKILCVDIQQKMLDLLKDRAAEAKITNYELIKGKLDDPLLPKGPFCSKNSPPSKSPSWPI